MPMPMAPPPSAGARWQRGGRSRRWWSWRRLCGSRRSTCRASGTTRRSRRCTCCTRASSRRCTRWSTPRTRRRCGTCSIWVWSRVFGTGAVALRLLVRARRDRDRAGRVGDRARAGRAPRPAIAAAAIVAVNPLFVWYSQEARAYALFVLSAALAMLCFLRAERRADARRAWRCSRSAASWRC